MSVAVAELFTHGGYWRVGIFQNMLGTLYHFRFEMFFQGLARLEGKTVREVFFVVLEMCGDG